MLETADKKQKKINGAILLAFSGLIAKLLGAVYRVPLTNIIGAEGIGMYQMIFPVYALALSLTSGAIPMIVARMVAEKNAVEQPSGAKNVFFSSLILMTFFGLIGAGIMVALAKPISLLQSNASIAMGYVAVAPSVLIVAVVSAFKGWFQGNMNMRPSAVAQIVEQILKMVIGLTLAFFLLKKGLIFAIIGAMLAVTVSELGELLVMIVFYFTNRAKTKPAKLLFKENAKEIVGGASSVAFAGLVLPITFIIDSFIIVSLLGKAGLNPTQATALYGLQTGAVNSLVNMPVVVVLALAVAVVPLITQKRVQCNAYEIKDKSTITLKVGFAISVPSFFGIYIFADVIIKLLYPSFDASQLILATKLLRISSVSVIFMSILQIYTCLLQALKKTKTTIYAVLIGAILKLIFTVGLTPKMSILALSFANIICYGVAMVIEAVYYKYLLGKNLKLFKNVSKILSLGVIMSLIVLPVALFIDNSIVSLLVGVLLAVVVYAVGLILFRVFDENELLSLPLGEKLVKLLRRLRLS